MATFVGYLMPTPFFQKDSSDTVQPIDEEYKEVQAFSESISSKVNVIDRLEIELTDFLNWFITFSRRQFHKLFTAYRRGLWTRWL